MLQAHCLPPHMRSAQHLSSITLSAELRQGSELTPCCCLQSLSNLAWVCGRLGIRPSSLLDAVCNDSATRIDEFSPPDIARMLWASAKLNHKPPQQFLEAAEDHIVRNFSSFGSQAVAMVLYGFAMQGHRSVRLFSRAADEVCKCSLQVC